MISWLNDRLITNWRKCFQLHCIKGLTFGIVLSALSTGLAIVYGSADASQHALIPSWLTYIVFFCIFTGSFIGRLWYQSPKEGDDNGA